MNSQALTACLLLCLGAAGTGIAAPATPPPGQIAISPSIVELAVGQEPANGSIRMQNLKKEPVTVKVEVYNWTLDEQNNIRLIPGDPQSLDRWLLISPVRFKMEPGGNQVIRYSIRPDVKPDPGEHRAMIYLTEQSGEGVNQGKGFQVLFRYGLAMYGYSGANRESAEIEGLWLDHDRLAVKASVRNTGNVHTRLTGNYAVWEPGSFPGFKSMRSMFEKEGEAGKPEGLIATGTLHSTPVLPGHRRTITEKLDITGPSGKCEIAIIGKIGGCRVEKVFK